MIKNIAILAGGNSSEYEVSIRSAQNVYDSLQGRGFNLFMVNIKGLEWLCDGASVDKNDFSIEHGGAKIKFDYALIMIHGTPGEDGILPAYFQLVGVPHSTCGFTSANLTFNKSLTKKALQDTGIAMARELVYNKFDFIDHDHIIDTLGLPLFVKPDASGSSYGVTKVKDRAALGEAIKYAFSESSQILLEEFIEGREVACGTLITTAGGEQTFPITEIVSKREFFDYEAKYDGMSDEITPADLPRSIVDRLHHDSLAAYKRLNCYGVVRMDYIIKGDTPYFIEVNTVPGMSSASIVPQQVAHMGMTTGDLWEQVIRDCKKLF